MMTWEINHGLIRAKKCKNAKIVDYFPFNQPTLNDHISLNSYSEHIRVKKILRKPCIAFVISFVLWCAPFQALIFFSHFAYQKKKIVYSVIFFLLETKKNFIDIIKREG